MKEERVHTVPIPTPIASKGNGGDTWETKYFQGRLGSGEIEYGGGLARSESRI
jgi:hypothetical protein